MLLPCEAKSTVVDQILFEDFNGFAMSKYHPTIIARCQQVALQKANRSVPTPAQQLELANAKKDKEPRAYHVCTSMTFVQDRSDAGFSSFMYVWFYVVTKAI